MYVPVEIAQNFAVVNPFIFLDSGQDAFTHLPLDKMAVISQMAF